MVFMPKLKPKKKVSGLRGSKHPAWKGDEARPNTKRARAIRLYVVEQCELCGNPARDRHHKDGNTGNNRADNIAILCRRCHMIEDGRLKRLMATLRAPLPPRPCRTCGDLATVFWNKECHKCNEYRRRHGTERPKVRNVTESRKVFGKCPDCIRKQVQIYSHGTCKWCYRARWAREDRRKNPRWARQHGLLI